MVSPNLFRIEISEEDARDLSQDFADGICFLDGYVHAVAARDSAVPWQLYTLLKAARLINGKLKEIGWPSGDEDPF